MKAYQCRSLIMVASLPISKLQWIEWNFPILEPDWPPPGAAPLECHCMWHCKNMQVISRGQRIVGLHYIFVKTHIL